MLVPSTLCVLGGSFKFVGVVFSLTDSVVSGRSVFMT